MASCRYLAYTRSHSAYVLAVRENEHPGNHRKANGKNTQIVEGHYRAYDAVLTKAMQPAGGDTLFVVYE